MPYTIKQKHYINVFMQHVDVVVALYAQPNVSWEDALAKANQIIDIANTGLNTIQTVLSVAGIALAVPSAGLSLGAAGAVITAMQVANSGYQLVKRALKGEEINPLSFDYSDKEDKELSLKILCREAASIIAEIRYRHIIEEIATDKGVAEFARYGASRVLKKIFKDDSSLSSLPAVEVILDFLYESTDLAKTKSNLTITVLEKYRSGSLIEWGYYTKWAYSRPRGVSITFTPENVDYVFYASDEGWGRGTNTTQAKYGYMFLPKEKLSVYCQLRNAKQISKPAYFTDLEPLLCAAYTINRQEVQAYLDEVRQSSNVNVSTRLSLNNYLKRELGVTVIAECHDRITLKGISLHGGNFSEVNFRRADLSECTLHDTCWTDAHLDGAILGGVPTFLKNAIFINITAEQSHWDKIDFSGSNFSYARMNGAKLNACLLQNFIDKNSIWELVTFFDMLPPAGSFIDRLNIEEQSRLQLEFRMLGLESRVDEISQRQNIHEQKIDHLYTQLQGFLFQWPRTRLSVPGYIPQPLHVIYGAWKIAFQNPMLQQTLHYYIELDALPYRNAPSTQREKLSDAIERFYTNRESLLLLHGDVGSGKSSTVRLCQQHLWERWNNENDWVPLVIELKQVPSKVKNFLNDRLCASPYSFNEEQIEYLQQHYNFFIILDGLDECPEASLRKIKDDCELDKWKAKILLTARTEWLQAQPDYRGTLLQGNSSEIFIAFLTDVQVNQYLQRRFSDTNILWSDYQNLWEKEKELHELAKSPVLLHIIYDVLPQIMMQLIDGKKHNRAWLYNIFLKAWFQREIDKPHPLDTVREDNEALMQCFYDYMQNLAFRMFCEKTLIIERIYRRNHVYYFRNTSISDPWIDFFDSEDEIKQRAQRSCPLSLERIELGEKKYHRYQFIHKSLMEYATASFLWQVLQNYDDSLGDPLLIWNQRFITEEQGILAFLVDFLIESRTRNLDEDRLMAMIFLSREKPANAIAASSAITLLNYIKYNFHEHIIDKNLSNIHIPFADLTEAFMPSMDLSKSDLSYVNFHNAVLVDTSFRECILLGTRFWIGKKCLPARTNDGSIAYSLTSPDILAYVDYDEIKMVNLHSGTCERKFKALIYSKINCIAWSFDGKVASGGDDKIICIWDVSLSGNDACIKKLEGHKSTVDSIVWSMDSKLVSGSRDGAVFVWNINVADEQACIYTLDVHVSHIRSLACSMDGRLAFGSDNAVVCISEYNLSAERACIRKLEGHSASINSVAWSVDSKLASGSSDGTVRVWDVFLSAEASCLYVLEGHTADIRSIAWSMDGKLASGGDDNTIRIWDISFSNGRQCINELKGHHKAVKHVTFSVDGKLISRSLDCTIRVWDCKFLYESSCIKKVTPGHIDKIHSIAWSNDGKLATCSHDKTIRIWDVELKADNPCIRIFKEHTDHVWCVAWSKDGKLASGSQDTTVRIWDTTLSNHSACVKRLEKHTKTVTSVAWSSSGKLASGGCDWKIYIWDVNLPVEIACLMKLEAFERDVNGLAWSIDGKLASISREFGFRKVCVWDINLTTDKACIRRFPEFGIGGYSQNLYVNIAWSINNYLAWNGVISETIESSIIRVLQIGKKMQTNIHSVAWSANGMYLITSSPEDILIWNAKNWLANPQRLPFGTEQVISFIDNRLALIRQDHIYVVELIDFPNVTRLRWISLNSPTLWLQGLDITGGKNLSSSTKQMLEKYGATQRTHDEDAVKEAESVSASQGGNNPNRLFHSAAKEPHSKMMSSSKNRTCMIS